MNIGKVYKLKTGDAELKLKWEEDETGDVYDVTYHDAARPSLYEALQALVAPCCRYLDLPKTYGDDVIVSGVSFTWTNEIMGAVVTLQKPLESCDAPLILNTPHGPVAPYAEGGMQLPEAMAKALTQVLAEAIDYINGERQQMDLFNEAEKAGADEVTTAPFGSN